MVSARPLISKSFSPFNNPMVTIPKAPITVGIIVTFMYHFLSVLFCGHSGQQSLQFCKLCLLFFLWIFIRSDLQAEIRGSICMSKYHWSLYVSFSRTDAGLCIYHLFIWSNLKFLQNSQWITLASHLCLVLYSFYANLLHSHIMWLMVSSLSPYNLHLLFCCVYPCFDWVGSYDVVSCCYLWDSVSF